MTLGEHEDALPGLGHVLQPLNWCDVKPCKVWNLEHAEVYQRLVVCSELANGGELFLTDCASELRHV